MIPTNLQQQLSRPKVNLKGTEERVTLEGDVVKIENIAFTKDGKEIVIATILENKEGLEKRKAQIAKQKQAYVDKLTADEAKIDELLAKTKE